MWYEVNVARPVRRNGEVYYRHWFATRQGSLTEEVDACILAQSLQVAFPDCQVSVMAWDTVGRTVEY